MLRAIGKGSTLRLRGEANDVLVFLDANPRVLDDGGATTVPISGTYGTITRINAKPVTGTGVYILGDASSSDRTVAYLTQQNDAYFGTQGTDRVFGYAGIDQLSGRGGNDYLDAGAGNDVVYGGEGKDRVFGREGDDELYGGFGVDKLYGGEGDDWLIGGDDGDRLYGEAGNDILNGGDGADVAYYGGDFADYRVEIVAGNYQVTDLRPGSPDGTDTLGYVERLHFEDRNFGLDELKSNLTATVEGDTLVVAGPAAKSGSEYQVIIRPYGDSSNGNQPIVLDNSIVPLNVPVDGTADSSLTTVDATGVTNGGVSVEGAIFAYLSPQDDFFFGDIGLNAVRNIAHGNDGDDTLWGGKSDDELHGGDGNDTILGDSPGATFITQSTGDDVLYGGRGNDMLYGNVANDMLFGEGDDDILDGGEGDDFLDGGDGNDIAVFFGDRADYDIRTDSDDLIVSWEESIFGTDTLRNIETLRFDDGDVDVSSLGKINGAAFETVSGADVPTMVMDELSFARFDWSNVEAAVTHIA